MEWKEHSISVGRGFSELLQHECDHLDGILAVSRAIDIFFYIEKPEGFFTAIKD